MNMPHSILESMSIVFATLFRFLNRWSPNRSAGQAPQNPYPFGTREWRIFAEAQATDHENMVLRIADLEAQVQQTTDLVDSLEALAASQDTLIHDLRLQNKALQDGPDPEVLQRIVDDLHTPPKRPLQPGAPEPQPGDPVSSAPSSAPVVSAAGSAQTSRHDPEPSPGTATGHSTARPRPLNLGQELERHLEENTEDE